MSNDDKNTLTLTAVQHHWHRHQQNYKHF